MFKKFLTFLGAIFLVIIIGLGLTWAYFAMASRSLDKESAGFVAESVDAIFKDWSEEEMIKRSHSSLIAKVPADQVHKLFETLRTIGGIEKVDGCQGQSAINYVPKQGLVTTAGYLCQVKFDKDTAQVNFTLLKEDGWKITGMNVNSPFFQGK